MYDRIIARWFGGGGKKSLGSAGVCVELEPWHNPATNAKVSGPGHSRSLAQIIHRADPMRIINTKLFPFSF